MDFLIVLEYTSILLALITAIVSLVLFGKLKKAFRYLSAFLIITIIMQIIAIPLNLNLINNLFLFHFHTPIEFTTFSILFWFAATKEFPKKIILVICSLFIVFCVINALIFESIAVFNSTPRAVEGILAIAFSIYYFYELFFDEKSIDLLKSPFFWLFAGWLIYFAGTFFLFNYANHSVANLTYPIIHSVLNIFLNLVYTYVLWLGSRKSTQ